MSTSMLVKKMREAAAELDQDVEIDAHGAGQFDEMVKEFDVVLLGPR
ncbi:PTS sugar transporter subunit IIB [Endozoicomonas montiporae]|nr:hypothetical protein [Endozoicomonas montiporae]